tara:strand:+ start:83 stop:1228 length:1146 start_codon:yes stop_codon:yes gene_type:complete
MNVHVIKDSKFSQNIYDQVIELLQKFNNPLNFIQSAEENVLDDIDIELDTIQEEKFKKKDEYIDRSICYSMPEPTGYKKINFPFERQVASPHDILKSCYNFRKENDIGDEEFVILLTEQANDLNWFSFGDEKNNAFVHTSDWGFFIGCNSAYPIAYEVLSNIFYLILFEGITDMNMHIHQDSRGCMSDFCENKSDIKLKMRTADICSACQNLMIKRQFPMSVSTQMFEIMEHLRKKLISLERFVRTRGASKVEFRGYTRKMFLTDLEDLEIRLTPLEKTVYHMFISHPEGIVANCMTDVKQELTDLYSTFFNGNNVANFRNSINNLCDYLNPSMQEKVSSIKRKIIDSIGSNMAKYYIIEKDNTDDRYKIKLDRHLVNFIE